MKVVALNGSPRKNGNCKIVINHMAASLSEEGIDTEVLDIGSRMYDGCRGCEGCSESFECVFDEEDFQINARKIYDADGLFVVAPVYFDGMPGQLKSFLDRLFYQDRGSGGLEFKIGAAAVVPRRTGGVATLDTLYHYFTNSGMLMVPSVGSNMVYGMEPGEAAFDIEGLDIIGKLGKNMAWLMKVRSETKDTILPPEFEKRKYMNFIR